MKPFTPEKRSGTITVRDLRPGNKVVIGENVAIVSKIERTDQYIYRRPKTARALRVSFLNQESIEAHPAQDVHLA